MLNIHNIIIYQNMRKHIINNNKIAYIYIFRALYEQIKKRNIICRS